MKEIVITNPNGITLNTKKTLVDDDIKILLDQSLLNQGGSGKLMLKLVATGTYNEEDESFDLGKELEEGKAYLIDYYSDNMGHHNTGVLYHASEKETCSCVVSCNTTSDGEDFCCLLYIRGMILIYSSPYGDIAITENDYIKVYELATTSESISEPTSNIKMMEVVGEDTGDQYYKFDLGTNEIDFAKHVLIDLINEENEAVFSFNFKLVMKEIGSWSIIVGFEGEYRDTIYDVGITDGCNLYYDIYEEYISNITIIGYSKIRVHYTPANITTPTIYYEA